MLSTSYSRNGEMNEWISWRTHLGSWSDRYRPRNWHTNKQTSKQTNKQTNKQTKLQTDSQSSIYLNPTLQRSIHKQTEEIIIQRPCNSDNTSVCDSSPSFHPFPPFHYILFLSFPFHSFPFLLTLYSLFTSPFFFIYFLFSLFFPSFFLFLFSSFPLLLFSSKQFNAILLF